MNKNYFKIAFRNLLRNKGISAINILGLSIGIATCLIIMLFVNSELSYDRYNKNADRIVRVSFRGNVQGEKMNESTVMPPVAHTLKAEFPEVEEATRIRDYGKPKLVYGDKVFRDDAFAFVDSNFLRVFTLPLIEGDLKTALIEPNTIVITKALAKKYFGREDPMGKVIAFKDGNNAACKVTGIIDKVPLNSHFQFELFASMASLPESREPTWMSSNFYTYLVLKKGYDHKKLEAKLPRIVDKYIGPQMSKALGVTLAEFRSKGSNISFHLQPLTDIHLHSDFANDLSQAGDIRYVYIFGVIALFMLLIACINFMNLSTAGASKRSREVGIRKVLGSLKIDLVKQFLLESILITTIAFILAMLLMKIALPLFNTLAEQNLTFSFADNPLLLPVLLLLILVIGIFAGSYPAFYLSSFKPVAVLKGKFVSGKRSIGLRSGLVVFQFFISIILIVSTIVVYKQLSYIQNKKLGYDKSQVLILSNTWILGKSQDIFRRQIINDRRIAVVSSSGYVPAGQSNNNNFFVSPDERSELLIKTLRYDVDENYIPALGIQLEAGRNFSKEFTTDSGAVIINEAAATAFGWQENAVGRHISRTNNKGEKESYTVIGVVKDFHFRSLHERISPLVMVLDPDQGTLIVKLKTKDIAAITATLMNRWKELGAEEPLVYSFLDDRYNNTYKAELKTGMILGIFTGLTIFVACLGLFGLARFTAERRTKEIGIRKVLGSSVSGIVNLLSMEFLKLVCIAFVVAAPIAWFIMNKWLQDFAYRINISWWIFLIAAFLAIVITLLTISIQAIKAALSNPVKSLRTE
ncbi:MAG TPA: ABC transporter permease [Chitinophagaceae bacterium]|nr:ABC transporter permease [Chitinophagaceae bacterium]